MQIHFHINISRPRWTRNWSLRRKVVVFLALALVLPPAAFVAASDVFSDVPNDHPFTNQIDAIYGARITVGTTATTFNPEDPASRGQIAAFLHRGLPRIAYNATEIAVLPGFDYVDTAVVTINTGGAPGGTGFVKLDGTVTAAATNGSACPCGVLYRIINGDGTKASPLGQTTAPGGVASFSYISGSLTWTVVVPTASTQTFRLQVRRGGVAGETDFRHSGELTALYVPFGSTGDHRLDPPPAQTVQAPQGVGIDRKSDIK